MALGALNQVHITVTDVARSVAYYRDVLQLPLLFEVPGQPMAFFQAGDVRLYLGASETPEFASKVVLYFTVDDVNTEYARLVAAGADIVDAPHPVHRDENGELWMAFLRDPDGHQLAITQVIPPG
jgi:predicted enzyme related to lactoylglutathione lyase